MRGFKLTRKGKTCRTPSHKLFTLEQAGRALPLVRKIVSDIVAQYQQLEHLQRKRKKLLRGDRAEEVAQLNLQASRGLERLNELIDEVNAIGCDLQDWETGLVDFRTMHEGRQVCLCWRLGEDSISHWHEVNAGVAGRQMIHDSFTCSARCAASVE